MNDPIFERSPVRVVTSHSPVAATRITINFQPLVGRRTVHVNDQIPEPIGGGLLYGEALTDCIEQEPVSVWGPSKEPQLAIPSRATKMLHLRHYLERLLAILAQTNHFDVCVQNSLLHLSVRRHFWVARIHRTNLSFDSLGECCSLGSTDFGISQGRSRKSGLRLLLIPMELTPRSRRRFHLEKQHARQQLEVSTHSARIH